MLTPIRPANADKPNDAEPSLAAYEQDLAKKPIKVSIPLAARNLVAESDVIQPLPQLLIKLCSYLDYKTASLASLAKDLSVDPRMTAKLLRLANSTSVAVRHRVTNVADAVNLLGAKRTVSLVISTNVVTAQSKLLRKLPEQLRNWCHSRNVLIASTASTFARRMEDVLPDTAYVLGLLQDVGILIMAYAHGKSYQSLLSRVQESGQVGLAVMEKMEFGITHADVSAAQLEKWDLPASLSSLVLHHHSPEKAAQEKSVQRLLHVMQVGEAMANMADRCTPNRHQTLMQLLGSYGTARARECKQCLGEAIATTAQSKQIFSIPAANAEVLNRLLQRINSGDSFAEADPVPRVNAAAMADSNEPAASEPAPATAPPESADEFFTPPAAAEPRPKSIVIIEDEPLLVKFITKVLEPIGLELQVCTGFEGARQVARDAAVILCDIELSREGEDGTDVIRALRKEGFSAPAIIMSADCSRATVTKCIEAGSNAFVLKPFDKETLLDKVTKFTGASCPLEPAGTHASA